MNCKNVHKNIWEYLDKNLSPEVTEAINVHLQSCNECNQLLYQMSRTHQLINKEEKVDFDPYFYTRLKARMEKDLLIESTPRHKTLPALRYAFASLLIILSIGAGALLGSGFKNLNASSQDNNISYIDQYTNDYYMFEMEDELIESILLNE